MDQFMKSLSFSTSFEMNDVVYPCMKILDWIDKSTFLQNKLSLKDIMNIAKGIVYIKTCYKLFRDDLPRRLIEQYPFYKLQVETFFHNTCYAHLKFVDRIFERVAQTEDGLSHLYTLESFLNIQPDEIKPSGSIFFTTMRDDNNSDLPSNRLRLITIVKKVYQLPKAQIDIAIKRILDYMPFSITGQIYIEPLNSPYYDACSIMVEKIYESFLDDKISEFFVKSMYVMTSTSPNQKTFYWQCLKNERFSNGIMSFYVRILEDLSTRDVDLQTDLDVLYYKNHKLEHIFYLFWITLSSRSPCHSDMHRQLTSQKISKTFLCVINRLGSIYE